MTKKITISLLAVILIVAMMMSLVACSSEYGNMPFELEYGSDNSVARMTGDKTAEELKGNPDRGFSIDTYITLDKSSNSYKTTYAFPSKCNHEEHMLNGEHISTYDYVERQFEKYKQYNIHVVTLTVFLTNFVGEDISDGAKDQLYSLLREFRNKDIQVILKFAYNHGEDNTKVAVDDIVKHAENFKAWFASSYATTIVKGTVTAFRLSFVGTDGNFVDNAYTDEELRMVSNAFSSMIPTNKKYSTQAPNVAAKNASSEYEKLINMGFYNDNISGVEDKYISGGTDKKSDAYKQYVYQSLNNYNSASIKVDAKDIDGKAVLKLMKDGSFTTLDLSRMFNGDAVNKALIDSWKETLITKKELDKLNLPYYDEWFLNEDMTTGNRSVFDYLRDFLGYNLSITNLKFTKDTRLYEGKYVPYTTITFTLTNYGMAAPLHIDSFEMYIKNNSTGNYINKGQGLTYPSTYDPKLLVSGGQINFTQLVRGDIDVAEGVAESEKGKGHSIGIKVYQDRSPRDLYVRLSNAVPYTSNINWIYSTENKK